MAKKIAVFVLVPVLLLLLLLVALPFWMPLALKPILERQGVEYGSYEREGYGRFILEDVTYDAEGLRVEAGRVEGYAPAAWLWNRRRATSEADFFRVEDWRVEILDTGEAATPEPEPEDEEVSVYEILTGIEEQLPTIIDWMPRASLGKGEVVLENRAVDVRSATWRNGRLAAEVYDRPLQQVIYLEGDLSGGFPFVLKGTTHPLPLAIEVTVSRTAHAVEIRSETNLAGNPVVVEAEFGREGRLPERAIMRSDQFRIPPEYLRLEGYRPVVGSVDFEWEQGRFQGRIQGEAEPLRPDEKVLPPLRVNAAASGDFDSFLVEDLEIRSPWLVASLSDPVAMKYNGELLSDESTFLLSADLAQQPFADLTGFVEGTAVISPGEEQMPRVALRLEGENLAGFDLELSRISFDGLLRWPELAVVELSVAGPGDSRLAAAADLRLDSMEIANGRVEGELFQELLQQWLPEGSSLEELSVAGTFEGPAAQLRHEGQLEAQKVLFEGTRPMDAAIKWRGEMENLEEFDAEGMAGEGRFVLRGASAMAEERIELLLEEVRLERSGEVLIGSEGRSQLILDWKADGPLLVSLDRLRWVAEKGGIDASASVAWPRHGEFSLNMRGLGPELLTDFLEMDPGAFDVRQVEAEGSWRDGPIDFRVAGDLWIDLGEGEELLLNVDATGEGKQMQIDRLRASSGDEVLAVAEGKLPVALMPGRESLVQVSSYGEVDFRARTEPGTRFWTQVAKLTGLDLRDPDLSMEITGTPYAPAGQILGSAALINFRALEGEGEDFPLLEHLRLDLRFDVDEVRLHQATLEVEGQQVEAWANVPMGPSGWQKAVQERVLPDWQEIAGGFRIPGAEVAAFSRFAPTIVSPQGKVQAEIEVRPGLLLDGALTLEGIATRPLLPLGSVQEGTARIEFDGRRAVVEEISGLVGGERLLITGEIDLPFEQELAFDMQVKARNLPLARQPGLVLRGDLDLKMRSRGEEVPLISGAVNLRDSFYLAQLRLMPAGSVASPERRPPFFSVSEEPFATWELDVELKGDEFLTVRGPIFRGQVSASFNLSGTLEEPRAVGNVGIDSGRVRFPFASMSIEQGEVALTRRNPFRPQLFIIATSTTFGYDLRMEITGTADAPVVEFTSNPPLTSEQALLMVTTGDLPREDAFFSTQQRASKFAVYIGQNLLYELTGDDSAADRLIIRSGEHISEQGRETFAIEYRLSDRWSLTGEYDRFDEYNAGFKWNIFSR